MTHQLIKYRLTAQGTIPDFLYLGEDGVNGAYSVIDSNQPWPRNLVQIGISKSGATGDFEVCTSKEDLQTYLTLVGKDWTQPNPSNPGNLDAAIPFDPVAATNWAWGRLEALNAA
jgi:hypothetical protein